MWDDLLAGGESALRDLTERGEQETVTLDFKEKSSAKHGTFETDDRRNLAKALSGFANSAGGLLVWGVKAREGSDKVDCAQELVAIAEIKRFRAEATSLVAQLVMPRLEGVRIASIPSDEDVNKGYLLVEVERSERRPHRGEAKGEKVYWKRSGDSFIAMEHYDVEDAFLRKGKPTLSLDYKITSDGSITSGGILEERYKIILLLRNDSAYSARFPYLFIQQIRGGEIDQYGLDGNRTHGLPRIPGRDQPTFMGGSDAVVHPDMEWPVTAVQLRRKRPSQGRETLNEMALEDYVLKIDCAFGCEDAPKQATQITIHGTELF